MNILGVSALYHDSAAALIKDGEVIAAAQEERFTRKKHDAQMPVCSMAYCLNEGNICSDQLDYVVYYDNPLLTLDRYMKNVLALGEHAEEMLDFGFESIFSRKLWIHRLIKKSIPTLGKSTDFFVTKHHIAHAASAFYPSPFERSVILTLDGVGEWTTLSIGFGEKNKLELQEELEYPHSLGLFYSGFSYFCGFKVNSGEYKFMGLAPYGEPVYYDCIRSNIIDIKEDGSFRLNLEYFDYQFGRTIINEKNFMKMFGERRLSETKIRKRDMDIAASVQLVTEEIIQRIVQHAKKEYGAKCDNLVIAGGVALNCVANGVLAKKNIFSHIWIQPAAGDAGGALGAALYLYYHVLEHKRMTDGIHDTQKGSLLGPSFSDDEIHSFLLKNQYPFHQPKQLSKVIARLLDEQNIIGLFRGRMEYGPRALGNRSIIADPRSEEMQSRLNQKIKFRESFRPFAPSVLFDRMSEYFELSIPSPYMLLCAKVRKERRVAFDLNRSLAECDMDLLSVAKRRRSDIPAVTHVDFSARIQSVDGRENKEYYDILKAFEELTGCGVIVNTSFNVRGEPIVCTLEDAYRCFMRSDMDILILGSFVLYKHENKEKSVKVSARRKEYELD